ncbi:hypothetical protein D7B24_001018 [Verticillium nonalfalfae]|uniref:Uncharacterized protein n=1 Tax=Verticillium nonalfalfae TaxID=1051616 RepID=A0A3M9Y0H7_9PEZI|nr:uncharacterized protein D7B24_001018 [Verticillium nonalfalfae]RNJ53993.1 hypothetical protein D7B24_001018 [Verticillium nonalfalfae]
MVLSTFFNNDETTTTTTTTQVAEATWTPLDFYEAAFVPPATDGSALAIEVPGLNASLYPYQKRTLKWLLHREAFLSAEKVVRGGILSEEMGLGKTLEIIGLILLHRRQPANEDSYLHFNNERLVKSGATLIVCPESLRQQWMDELERHAPHLLVSYYPGRAQFRNQTEEEVFRNMAAHDVIVTTYKTLTAEIHYATKPPERSRRREREYERPKSPLTQISWWRPLFHNLFHDIAIRHTKKLVRDELELPAQKRFVITLPFTAVEEQHYQSIFAEMAEVCDVDLDGNPMLADWDPKRYEEAMRTYLNRLRQAALHPEVGVQNRRALGHRAGPLRTVDEVLTAMIEQSDASIRTEQRAYFTARLNHGQLLENGPLVKEALVIWDQTRREVEEVVGKCRQELDAAMNAAKRTISENGSVSNTNGTCDEDVVEGLDEYQASPEVGEALMRLRSALEVQHRAIFFCANARFQIKSNRDFTEPDSAEFSALQKLEEEGYETAKGVRREILSENHRKATKAMRKLGNDAVSQNFVTIPELIPNPVKGLESATVVEKVEELYGFLNLQANLIDEWREVIVGLLLQPLVDEENETETTGDEFVNSTAIQEQLMVHVQVLRATIADRQDAISGLQNMLVKHETQTTKALAMDGEGPAPKTLIELLDVRNKVKPSLEKHGCLRGAIGELRALAARLPPHEPGKDSRANMEHAVVNRQIKDIQAQIQAQTKASQRLERECDEFTNAMNLRLDYYRQLQAISDSVDVYEGPKTQDILAKWVNAAETAHRKLSSAEAKQRYLVSLRDGGASKANEPKMCIICQTDFTIGVLTVCGHQFCKHCLMLWFKAHHNCPMCKRKLKITDLHTITLKPRELTLHTEDVPTSTPGKKRSAAHNKSAIYSEFGADKLAQIRDVDLEGPPLTTKVDSIVRHLLWLRESDPGAKSIVFSQYRDFLQVIGSALSRSRIGYTSIDKPNGVQRFKEDAGLECFLLHGRAQSSGLNLVNASHVFLCEPLLNTAIELQAIARVDRIGQQHETTVWLYLIEGTVEESIYNLSVKRRLQHLSSVTKGKSKDSTPDVLEPTLEAANTFEMENASLSKLMSKDRSAGEAVDKEDLWECLFGHVARAANSESREERGENPAVMNLLAAEAAESRRMMENASQLET